MKNLTLITCSIILILFSCTKPHSSNDGRTINKTIFQNESNHIIKIKNYYNFDLNLIPNEEYLWQRGSDGFSHPKNIGIIKANDSVEVVYDDTLSVFHGSKVYNMLRDIRRNDMFDFTESTEGKNTFYTYTYIFTNADFDEAKTK